MSFASPTETFTYVRALRLLVGGYGAYGRETRRETDVAVREEILRTASRVRAHAHNVHDRAYAAGDLDLARSTARLIEEIDGLRNDVRIAETGGEHPFFAQQISASRRTIDRLIEHDHATLDLLRKAVNLSNDLEAITAEDLVAANGNTGRAGRAGQAGRAEGPASSEAALRTGDGGDLRCAARCQQVVSSARGHFSERRAVLRGIRAGVV